MPKILVVDDEADVRNVVTAILNQAGYDVVEAEYGLDGYSKAQSEKPDLVLLDLMMPVVDGFEVLGKLKQNPSTRSIPVIILTAKSTWPQSANACGLGPWTTSRNPAALGSCRIGQDRTGSDRNGVGVPEPQLARANPRRRAPDRWGNGQRREL